MIVDELHAFEVSDDNEAENLDSYNECMKLEKERSGPWYRQYERKRKAR